MIPRLVLLYNYLLGGCFTTLCFFHDIHVQLLRYPTILVSWRFDR